MASIQAISNPGDCFRKDPVFSDKQKLIKYLGNQVEIAPLAAARLNFEVSSTSCMDSELLSVVGHWQQRWQISWSYFRLEQNWHSFKSQSFNICWQSITVTTLPGEKTSFKSLYVLAIEWDSLLINKDYELVTSIIVFHLLLSPLSPTVPTVQLSTGTL